MKQQLLATVLCTGCLVFGVRGQTADSPGATPGSSYRSSQSTNYNTGRSYGYGRMGHQELRASKLTGADVKTASGESLGKIEDVLLNAFPGRIDFAVISYSSSSTSSSTSTTSPGTSTSTTSSSGEKLVPVPWTLLRPSGGSNGSTSSTSSTTASSTEQPSFVFNGDKSKLDSAPSFDRSNWPDVTQFEWRQRILSHFGMQPGAATGGATSPGGFGSESSTSGSNTNESPTTTSPSKPDQQ